MKYSYLSCFVQTDFEEHLYLVPPVDIFILAQMMMSFQNLLHMHHLRGHHMRYHKDHYVCHQMDYDRIHCHLGDNMDINLHCHFLLEGSKGIFDFFVRMFDEYICDHALSDPCGYHFLAGDAFVFHLRRASMRCKGNLFGINIPKMSTKSAPIMTCKLIIETHVLKTVHSRRVHYRGYGFRNHRSHL